MNEPVKPSDERIKTLAWVSITCRIVGYLLVLAFVVTSLWVLFFAGLAVLVFNMFGPSLRHTQQVQAKKAWQAAQWQARTSVVKSVTNVNVTLFRHLIGDISVGPHPTSVEVEMENGDTLTISWLLFSNLFPSERLSYETRVLGKREYRGIIMG